MIITFLFATSTHAAPTLILINGAPGTEEYGRLFKKWAGQWEATAKQGKAELHQVSGKDKLKSLLSAQPKNSPEPLWLVMIGHGTFDGKTAKFNLRGPDLSAAELAEWLKDHERPLAIINCASSSAPFINALSGPNRVILTATRSGAEQNFARLGGHLATAITDPKADLDKDEQVSLLEAFLTAAHRTAEFYKTESRLATEHALIDDNGDTRGTPADWFRGIRVTKETEDGTLPDGLRAHQLHLIPNEAEQKLSPAIRAKRNTLELQLAKLRTQKKLLDKEEYYQKLEPLLLQLAKLYELKPSTQTQQP
ncbi:MAG: hypothetical protein CMO74_15020 [Verrucomicrobiales bacterium]|nr:hypothetical protein [Verrucomicrobiales bacterium]